MSDDNYRKPSSPRATRIGLGLTGVDASYDRHESQAASGQAVSGQAVSGQAVSGMDMRGLPVRGMAGMQAGANTGLAEVESDTRYMDPPSETHGTEREQIVQRLRAEASAARAGSASSHGLFGSTLRAHTSPHAAAGDHVHENEPNHSYDEDALAQARDIDAGNPGLFRGALDHTLRAQPLAAGPALSTPRPPPPAPSGSRAPEAWRDEVRRMVERAPIKGPTSGPPGASSAPQPPSGVGGFGGPNTPGGASLPPSNKPSLRLKLDADAVEESYRAPKSALPKLLIWLMVLGLIGGGVWFYADSHGGVTALFQQFRSGQPTLTTQDPTPPAAAPAATAQPPAAVAPATAQPAQVPQQAAPPAAASAAPSATSTAPAVKAPAASPAKPQAAITPKPPAASPAPAAQAQQPDVQTAEPAAAEAAPATKASEPAAAEAAPATKPAPPKAPPRQVRPQQPVVKVRPIEAPSSAEPAAPPPPDGLDIPYVPLPGDPPAPDEAR